MNKALSILLIVAIVSMCGCVDVPYIDDGDIIEQYNDYIDTYNADMGAYTTNREIVSDSIDDYNQEVESYNAALWGNKNRIELARDDVKDAQFTYRTNAIEVKGRLEMFRTFLYDNQDILERNGVDVREYLNMINEWISEIDYNIQFAGI
jgi:putative cell wall-binding protein